jgi:hypothetical protein
VEAPAPAVARSVAPRVWVPSPPYPRRSRRRSRGGVGVASGVGRAGDHGAEAVEEGPEGRPGACAGAGPPPGGVQGRVDRDTAAGVGAVQVDLCSTAGLTGGWRAVPQAILMPARKRRGGERR